VTEYSKDSQGSIPCSDIGFSLLHQIQTDSTANPASYPVGTVVLIPELKRPENEPEYSPNLALRSNVREVLPPRLLHLHCFMEAQIQLYIINFNKLQKK
jgi:hypothetical protein